MEKKTVEKVVNSESKTVSATVKAVTVPVVEQKMTGKKVVEKKIKTDADKIWDEIKDKNIDMFALPNQIVNQYCKPIEIEPSKLYLLTTASAVLPSLESSLGEKFLVERVDRFVVVSRVPVSLLKK